MATGQLAPEQELLPDNNKPLMSARRVALIGAAMVALGPVSMALYTPAMPRLVEAFGTDAAMIKMTLTAYFFGFAVSQLVSGPFSDAFGRRQALTLFLGIYTLGAIGSAFATSVEMLIAFRLVQGIGASVGVSTARAIVRDLFTGDESSKIMNTIAMFLTIGPALAPVIGGFMLEITDWHSIFLLMIVYGGGLLAVVLYFQKETVTADASRFKPTNLIASYAMMLKSKAFMAASTVLAGAIGGFYMLATILPFVMIEEVGLTPTQFGMFMVCQPVGFFTGSFITRHGIRHYGARRMVTPGVALVAISALIALPHAFGLVPTVISVLIPMSVFAFGSAFIMPHMSTAVLAPFPAHAGTASALTGFMQMGGGLLGGFASAIIGDPVSGLGIVMPTLILISVLAYIIHMREERKQRHIHS